MIDYEKEFGTPAYASRLTLVTRTFALVYGWMAAGLALSGLVAWYTFESGLWQQILRGPGLWGCLLAEIGLVLVLTSAINRMAASVATLLFLVYAAMSGLTLSVVFVAYELSSVASIFFITAGMFAGLALWGTFTKGDLSSVGSLCGMALWGIVLAMIVNLFLRSSGLDLVLSFVGVLVFTGLTMYDAQKVKELAVAGRGGGDAASLQKAGILGALVLYLDFVNLFLYLLRLFGKRR